MKGEDFLRVKESRSQDTNFPWNLSLESRIHNLVGVSIESNDADTPSKLPEVTRILQGPQDATATTLRRIMIGDEEDVFQNRWEGRLKVWTLSGHGFLILVFYEIEEENQVAMEVQFRRGIILVVSLLIVLAAVHSAPAQEDPQPSKDPAVFKAQLLQFTQLTRKNLADIQALPPDDSSPVDPRVRQNARHAYVLVRAARWGMDVAMQTQTYKDPMLVLAHKRVEEAWNLARYPVDYTSAPRAEYISQSVQNLTRSLRLVQQALVILP